MNIKLELLEVIEKQNELIDEMNKLISDLVIEPLPLIEVGDSRFISLATYYLHEPHIGSFQP